MLRNPKCTGYMVYGRHRVRNGHRIVVPQDQWLWSPAPVHPAIVDRQTWDLAQQVSAGHGSSRDGDNLNTHPARFYPYRSRLRCRDCKRWMAGNTTPTTSPPNSPTIGARTTGPTPNRDTFAGQFFATRIFGPERAALLAAQLPATDAQAAAGRDAQEAAIKARIARIEPAQDSKIVELEDSGASGQYP